MRKTEGRLWHNLLEEKIVTREQIEGVRREHRRTDASVGSILLKGNMISPKDYIKFLQHNMGVAYANLNIYIIDPHVVRMIPRNVASQYQVFPLLKVKNTLIVAMVDPLDSFVVESLKNTLGCNVKALASTEREIVTAIGVYYERYRKPLSPPTPFMSAREILEYEIQSGFEALSRDTQAEQDATVTRLVNIIIMKAIQVGASDVHIEPECAEVRIRFRIDGILHEVMSLADEIRDNLISRVKIMCNMDISEKRIPQDGRTSIKTAGKSIDIRVSTYPAIYGEKIVLRLLDKSSVLLTLDEMGFEGNVLDKFKDCINRPTGIILVTGPTGSGKSTTLYAVLDAINSMDRNIITIEDPVEYELPHITQGQVLPKAGFSFATGLRAILRQDPDVIMVGEIRDLETAEIAIRAALTGHMVLSTLHTNDAPGAVTRLIDMGVEPFLVASSVVAVLGQRLVRSICENCKQAVRPPLPLLEKIGFPPDREFVFYEGKGCDKCNETGYKGRTSIQELFLPDEDIRQMIIYKESSSKLMQTAVARGMRTLREHGYKKVLKGITSIEEVLRVTQDDFNT